MDGQLATVTDCGYLLVLYQSFSDAAAGRSQLSGRLPHGAELWGCLLQAERSQVTLPVCCGLAGLVQIVDAVAPRSSSATGVVAGDGIAANIVLNPEGMKAKPEQCRSHCGLGVGLQVCPQRSHFHVKRQRKSRSHGIGSWLTKEDLRRHHEE